jgi:hypothetical protein
MADPVPVAGRDVQILVWRYLPGDKNYAGWHMTANGAGSRYLLEVCRYLTSSTGRERNILLAKPNGDEAGVTGSKGRVVAAARMRISVSSPDDEEWRFEGDEQQLTLTLGGASLREFQRAIEGVPQGSGDYLIGAPPERLWIWWYVG